MTAAPFRVYVIGGPHADTGLTAAVVGGKAANLSRLDRLGLRVPPALALDAALCRDYATRGSLPENFRQVLRQALTQLEESAGFTLGGRRPLLVSVRSSPPTSMPGMLETILNVGLTEESVSGLIRRTGNAWLAWDALHRLVRAFAVTVRGCEPAAFDQLTVAQLQRSGAASIQELDALTLRELTRRQIEQLEQIPGAGLPADPLDQIIAAVEAVLRSWHSPRAAAYRALRNIDDASGTGVLIQAMVFGNSGARSGSGVAFTRNPATGDDELYMDFLANAQGDDIVAGRQAITDSGVLQRALPGVWTELQLAKMLLEREFRDMQDVEFTVENGQLFFLQTRPGARTTWASLRIATDMVTSGLLDQATALSRLVSIDLSTVTRTGLQPGPGDVPLARAASAGIGVAIGAVVFDARRAQQMAKEQSVVLLRPDMTTEDFAGLAVAAGAVTTFGGRTSHAAVVARQLGKVCLVGCSTLRVDETSRECTLGTHRLREGDVVTLDGEAGLVYAGRIPIVSERPLSSLALVNAWREAAAAPA
jgi:pyruvate, orthophosphate dikinase